MYALLVQNMDRDQREEFDAELYGEAMAGGPEDTAAMWAELGIFVQPRREGAG